MEMGESSANVIWTGEDDATLIDFVRNNEPLYNIRNKDYRKGQLKQNLWNSIGATLQKSGSDCCKRWAYVRDYYIRRRGKGGPGGGEAAKKRAERLFFLDGVPSAQRNIITCVGDDSVLSSQRKTIAHIGDEFHEPDVDENVPNTSTAEPITRCNRVEQSNKEDYNNKGEEFMRQEKRRKVSNSEERLQVRREMTQEKETELDETDLFFKSMIKIVKKLPRYEQIHLRMEIASLVGNAELRSISNESRPNSTPTTNFPEEMLAPVKAEPSNDEGQCGYVSDASLSI